MAGKKKRKHRKSKRARAEAADPTTTSGAGGDVHGLELAADDADRSEGTGGTAAGGDTSSPHDLATAAEVEIDPGQDEVSNPDAAELRPNAIADASTDEPSSDTTADPGTQTEPAMSADNPGTAEWGVSEAVAKAWKSAGLVAAAVLSLYVFRLAPTAYMLDSGELVATTQALGVSHPPGHPAFHLLTAGSLAVPIGSAALRVHFMVALYSAMALGALPLCAALLGWIRTRTHLWFASTIAMALAFTPAFAQQSVRAEVYSLNVLLIALATTLACVRWPRRPIGATIGVALALGVGLLNHHYLVLFTFPAFLVAVVGGAGGSRAKQVLAGALAGVGLLVGYLYLPLRALARARVGWGWPDSFEEVYWLVSAQAFQKTAEAAVELDVAAGLTNVGAVLSECLTLPVLGGSVVGILLLCAKRKLIGAVLLIAIVFNLATQTLFAFDPTNPDVLGYFMPTFWWLGLGLIFAVVNMRLPGQLMPLTAPVQVAFGTVALAGIAFSAAGGYRSVDLGGYWDSELLRDEAFNGLQPDSVWITTYFETGFNTWYAQSVEDRRPDVEHLHQAFLTYDFYSEMLDTLTPTAAGLRGEGELLSLEAAANLASSADVRIEAEQLVTREFAAQCIPSRLYLHLLDGPVAEGEFPRELAIAATEQLASVRARFNRGSAESETFELQTGRNLLWAHFNLALQMCAADRHLTCRAMVHEARRIAPDDAELAALAARLEAEAAQRAQ